MNLKNKTAIITGASSGIGAFFCRELVNHGTKVYALARSEDKLQKLKTELGELLIPIVGDVTDTSFLQSFVDNLPANEPDILVNNAGFGAFDNVEDMEISTWDTMIQTNLSAVFYITRLVVPRMKKNESVCHIVNIASVAGLLGNPKLTAYNASKFGLRGFSEALFKELRYDGIKVTCMFPGSIATPFFDKVGMEQHSNMLQPEDVAILLRQILEFPDNFLIDEVTLRPLDPRKKDA